VLCIQEFAAQQADEADWAQSMKQSPLLLQTFWFPIEFIHTNFIVCQNEFTMTIILASIVGIAKSL
jgi:hypothetical protein